MESSSQLLVFMLYGRLREESRCGNDLHERKLDRTWIYIYICLQSSKKKIKNNCPWWIYSMGYCKFYDKSVW
ncbi:unnamed protein product [Brassica rapa]|uniref:Uncharacterized protein n=1 Tax=Brassica campestris TaxID=3711 RepID=A0A3P6CDD3_BRACM|nr:unnamed protein product [Brassica rapa]VDD16677.1 unnamed protein product [Brassica rapa]